MDGRMRERGEVAAEGDTSGRAPFRFQIEECFTDIKLALHSLAIALASNVFPHPGGP